MQKTTKTTVQPNKQQLLKRLKRTKSCKEGYFYNLIVFAHICNILFMQKTSNN